MKNIFKIFTYTLISLISINFSAQTDTENYTKSTKCITVDCSQKKESIIYFDALGNPKASIFIGGGNNAGQSLAGKNELDAFGRKKKNYLPGIVSTGLNFPSSIDYSLYPEISTFDEIKLESSPLGRTISKAEPGDDWKMGSGHETNFVYDTNLANEVRMFKAATQFNATFQIYDVSLTNNYDGKFFYDANVLYKTSISDEDDNVTIEFKDKEGKTILQRKVSEDGNVDTYYVYDIFGNLAFVLSPKLSDLAGNQALLNDSLFELAYQYKYDSKNRLVEKKMPGKDWEYIVYDNQDRVVGLQNAVMRLDNQWLFTKYDKFDRVAISGLVVVNGLRAEIQSNVSANMGANNIQRSDTGYNQDNIIIYYTNNGFGADGSVITINYYDNYPMTVPEGIPSTILQQETASGNLLNGLLTQTVSRELGTNKFEYKHLLYDKKNFLPVREYIVNTLGGYTVSDKKFSFSGKLLNEIIRHKKTVTDTEIVTNEELSYDYYDRLAQHTHQINNEAKEYLVRKKYDGLGRLSEDWVGNNLPSSPLQTVNYNYNIRGWLTNVNNVDDSPSGVYGDLFSYRLDYNNSFLGENKYDGNISSSIWKSSTDEIPRGYAYSYDKVNRLRDAVSYNLAYGIVNAYAEQVKGYDKNGNITGFIRTGDFEIKNANLIDDLTYIYKDNSNKLLKVIDDSNQSSGFSDGTNLDDDFGYDDGNLSKDLNKGITKINYNYLNLPTEVIWNNNKRIIYSYNSQGKKIRKKFIDGAIVTETLYLDGFQYKDNVLQFLATDQGYINVSNGNVFNYVYHYKDNLNNIRLSYQKESDNTLKILENSTFYPFGLKHSGYNNGSFGNSNYKFSLASKEAQEDKTYDFGARFYMPDIGRFGTQDPMQVFDMWQSSYSYANNNPVLYSDEYGLGILNVIGNLFQRLGHAIKNLFNNECGCNNGFGGESIGDAFRREDFPSSGNSSSRGSNRSSGTPRLNGNSLPSMASIASRPKGILLPNFENVVPTINSPISARSTEFDRKPTRALPTNVKFSRNIEFKQNSTSFYDKALTEKILDDLISTLLEHADLKLIISGNSSYTQDDDMDIMVDGVDGTVGSLKLGRAGAIRKLLMKRGIEPRRILIKKGRDKELSTNFELKK
ncbi:DUF6443 domain-containing protein [Chryseobacterium sp. MMS23-Vi53]|uniref:DUF6443 domain-containing protein n=1 Tax=Chryseobacterium sp. MMS23-Vi53 TaxID=3386644 RepID=UPI0039EBD0A5